MDDASAFSLLDMIERHFNTSKKQITWADIAEDEPDEIDLTMLLERDSNPDCNEYISRDDLIARRLMMKNVS